MAGVIFNTFEKFNATTSRKLQWYYSRDGGEAGFINQILAVDREGTSHFFANGVDQGIEVADLPEDAIEADNVVI